MNNKKIVRVGTTELYFEDAFEVYQSNKYIVNYSGVYQLFYSQAQQQITSKKVYDKRGLVLRGRFHIMTGKHINRLIGYELLN